MKPVLFYLLLLNTISLAFANEYIIFNIDQNFPMGEKNDKKVKNYYVNAGGAIGVEEGTILEVFRMVSILDPFAGKKRYNHEVKIGELTVVHTERDSAIATKALKSSPKNGVLFEISSFMVGDRIVVKTPR